MFYPLPPVFRARFKRFDRRLTAPVDSGYGFFRPLEYGFLYAAEVAEGIAMFLFFIFIYFAMCGHKIDWVVVAWVILVI